MSELDDLRRDDWEALQKYSVALYELRLGQLGPHGDDASENALARRWACAVFSEAMCVLELQFGVDEARNIIRAMLERDEHHVGPRTKQMRN
jgi:hypothetical protein